MRKTALLPYSVALALTLAGCEEKKPEPPPAPTVPAPTPVAAPTPPPPPAAPKVPAYTGPTGSIKGVVTFTGKAPEMAELNRKSDPVCAKDALRDEEVVVTGGKLKNVLVHLNGAVAMPAPDAHVVLDQNRCMYAPRVAAAVTGQGVDIKNSDATLHNVHGYKGAAKDAPTLFNLAEIADSPAITKTFDDSGTLLKFKCDVHPWMTGYLWVQNNPLFAVTGADGSFTIAGVPPGKYELEAWHERYGSKKVSVTVVADKPAAAKFDFSAKDEPKK